jgi:mannose-6-phosphate isomerase-like protein (cupin superfamily)
MSDFDTRRLPTERTAIAPDGSDVRLLLELKSGGMAHFELGPGQTSRAATHPTVEEIWFFLSGRGQMWRKQGDRASIVDLYPGICITIPLGVHFRFAHSDMKPSLPSV